MRQPRIPGSESKERVMSIREEFCAAWRAGVALDGILTRFVVETHSRASGCWQLEKGFLKLKGFGWASDMPNEVSQGFQNATRRVSLDQMGLGIVKAAVTGKPAIGRRDALATGLDGSANWIAKFGANTSLAIPIRDFATNSVIGVLAVSTAAFVEEGDALWETLHALANDLGRATERIKHSNPPVVS